MVDYKKVLSPEMQAFIAKTQTPGRTDAPPQSVAEIRSDYEEMCQKFHVPTKSSVKIYNAAVNLPDRQIKIRHYHAAEKGHNSLILFFHGGGFVLGSLDSHDSICADICAGTRMDIIATDYRLAPEFQHPAQIDDSLAVLDWALQTYPDRNLILTGDSAGAWLAASLCHLRGDQTNRIMGQLLIYPTLGGDMTKGSYQRHKNAPMLTLDKLYFYGKALFGTQDIQDRIAGPLSADDFSCLPPTIIFAAECDPLHDDGPEYAAQIVAAGQRAVCITEKGLVHAYLRGRYEVPEITASFDSILQAFSDLDEAIWRY